MFYTTYHMTVSLFRYQVFLGDSYLPLETIINYRMYQTTIQHSNAPAAVVLTNPELRSLFLCVWGRHKGKWMCWIPRPLQSGPEFGLKTGLQYYNAYISTRTNFIVFRHWSTRNLLQAVKNREKLKSTHWHEDLSKHRITAQIHMTDITSHQPAMCRVASTPLTLTCAECSV